MSPFSCGIHSALRRGWAAVAVISGVLLLAPASPASAFTSGPHTELTGDAAAAEGFGPEAVGVLEVDNTFMDLYQWVAAVANPYSGYGSAKGRLLVQNLATENWPHAVVASATRSHFDNNPEGPGASVMEMLGTTAGVTQEWERLQKSVWMLMREAQLEDNPQKALQVLGMSLHQVQDFYAHTNWIEPESGMGADGPGWQEHGFGTYPTWFDVPARERSKYTIYGDSTPGHSRKHGYWSSDGNISLATMMNKDSPPRPFYVPAAIASYFATRQWIQAVRLWVGDDDFWQRMQSYHVEGNKGRELTWDRDVLFQIMLYAGRWEGQGEPFGGPGQTGAAGDLLSLRGAIKYYFEQLPKSSYRQAFERLIVRMAEPHPTGQVGPVPSSQRMQERMWVVMLRILKMGGVGIAALGDPLIDQADMYVRARIDEQPFHTDVIHGHDDFSFSNPYEPLTKFKVVPKGTVEPEPVESVQVEVKTADARWAGTDDDVSLCLGPKLCFGLDKRLYNDFERNDRDTYSVPIDTAVRNGLRVGDITEVKIFKTPDGVSGGWKLAGVKLTVNDREFYNNQGIDRWLENNRRIWEAPNFMRRDPSGPMVPIWLQLREDDSYYGGDDDGDINPDDNRDTISFGYVLGRKVERTTKGANRFGGRVGFGGDLATLTFSVETLVPELMRPPGSTPVYRQEPGPPAPAGRPDLVVTELDSRSVTVRNQGDGPAGPFRLRAVATNGEDTLNFGGLAAGASETRRLGLTPCEFIEATVDDLEQVEEIHEGNNRADTSGLDEVC